jgi:predicted transcriptional regulator of viral defense system
VLYGRNTVGIVVKMLREEYDIETDPKRVQQIMNPAKVSYTSSLRPHTLVA